MPEGDLHPSNHARSQAHERGRPRPLFGPVPGRASFPSSIVKGSPLRTSRHAKQCRPRSRADRPVRVIRVIRGLLLCAVFIAGLSWLSEVASDSFCGSWLVGDKKCHPRHSKKTLHPKKNRVFFEFRALRSSQTALFARGRKIAKIQVADSWRVAGAGQSDKKCPDNYISFVFNAASLEMAWNY